ncbi:MAG TPA: amino acid ABC transporter permease [Roseiflexaceae bacterium]|nr:amino acid ABC transporter permease [Roseiflexaceae bacterium]
MTAAPLPTTQAPAWRRPLQIALQILGAILLVVLIPVAFGMEWRNFAPVLRPTSLRFLSIGILATVAVSLAAIVLSLPLAVALALGRLARQRWLSWPCIAVIEVVRALPLLLLIFYVNLRFPGLSAFESVPWGDSYGGLVLATIFSQAGLAMVVSLTAYTAAVNAELLRSGILSLERGQNEAARSLGMTYWQAMRLVILPQAFRRILAPLIAQFTILLKDTSLGSIIGFVELQRRAVILYNRDFNPMEVLFVVALIYFALNYLLGLSSRLVERRGPSVQVRISEL